MLPARRPGLDWHQLTCRCRRCSHAGEKLPTPPSLSPPTLPLHLATKDGCPPHPCSRWCGPGTMHHHRARKQESGGCGGARGKGEHPTTHHSAARLQATCHLHTALQLLHRHKTKSQKRTRQERLLRSALYNQCGHLLTAAILQRTQQPRTTLRHPQYSSYNPIKPPTCTTL